MLSQMFSDNKLHKLMNQTFVKRYKWIDIDQIMNRCIESLTSKTKLLDQALHSVADKVFVYFYIMN